MVKRTSHGEGRHDDAGRSTSEAANDKATANEVYLDIESGYYIFIGARVVALMFSQKMVSTTRASGRHKRIGRVALMMESGSASNTLHCQMN